MLLSEIIAEVELSSRSGEQDPRIGKICFDSRLVEEEDLFVAVHGLEADGHQFIGGALQSGAAAVVYEDPTQKIIPGVPMLRVNSSRKALAQMASAYYGHPSRELSLVGVTGTNGKTTIATLLHQMHILMGFRAGLLSTIEIMVGEDAHPATHTTPDPLQINALLRKMVDEACEYCFMEVSSHAIDQERVTALEFNGGIFTNLTRDHLDYHKDFREYLKVKKRFFDHLN